MSVQKINMRQTTRSAEMLESWEEHYGAFVVFVERRTVARYRSGRRLSKTVERAQASRAGSAEILYQVDAGDRSSLTQRLANGNGLRQFVRPREEVIAWLFANHPEARTFAQEAITASEAESAAQRGVCVARVREIGMMPFLAEEGVGYVSTTDLAKMMGITPSQLGSFLRTAGFATREGKHWAAADPDFVHRENGTFISWNPVGAHAVWTAAYAHGVTLEPPQLLASLLRKRFPYLPEWTVIEAAMAGGDGPAKSDTSPS